MKANLEARLKRLETRSKGEQYSGQLDLYHEYTGMNKECIENKFPNTTSLLSAIGLYHEKRELGYE